MISNLTLESLLHQLVITQLDFTRSLTFIPIATENMVEKLLLLTSLTQVGYTQAPWITISGGVDLVEAVAGIGTGSVQFITITDGGSGYTTAPTVTFSNPLLDNIFCDSDQITCDSDQLTVDDTDIPGEETARALSVINSAGIVTGIYVTYGGVGYQDPPTITIAGPVGFETGTGVGRFIFNEIVTGSTSGTTC